MKDETLPLVEVIRCQGAGEPVICPSTLDAESRGNQS
jgi:hypothetical protein